MRDYYRKCAGYLSLMNAVLLTVASCLAIYIADIDELDVDEGTGVVMLNGLYFVFVVGAIFALISLVAGIIAARGKGEGVFAFQRVTSVIITLVMIFSVVTGIYVIRNKEIEWDGEIRAIAAVYLIASLFSVVCAVITFLYSQGGMEYYDRNKKLAKDAPDIDTDRPARVELGVALLCASGLNISIAFLSLYFCNMIRYFDKTMVEESGGFSDFYRVLFFVGLIIAGISIMTGVAHFVINKNEVKKAGLFSALGSWLYLAVFAVSSMVAMTRDFVKSQCPDVSYIIFGFVLCIFSAMYLVAAAGKAGKGKRNKDL